MNTLFTNPFAFFDLDQKENRQVASGLRFSSSPIVVDIIGP